MKLPSYITKSFFEGVCAANGLVLDTNMLVLYLVGLASDGRVHKYPRTKSYTEEDFLYLCALIKKSKNKDIKITPHSVTEALYLIGMDPRRKHDNESGTIRLTEYLRSLSDVTIGVLAAADESIYCSTPDIIHSHDRGQIVNYGIPDLSFRRALVDEGYAFLSSDSVYASQLYSWGVCATSLEQLKMSAD